MRTTVRTKAVGRVSSTHIQGPNTVSSASNGHEKHWGRCRGARASYQGSNGKDGGKVDVVVLDGRGGTENNGPQRVDP